MQNTNLDNYSLENTINRYYQISKETQDQKKEARPILITKTIEGEERLHIVERRGELSVWKRIQAYFGFGEASLKNVAKILREKKWDIHSEDLDKSLSYIDSKICSLNKSALIQRVGEIIQLKLVNLSQYNCGVSTTYHPDGSSEENDNNGILDFVHVIPEMGCAYVAGGTGHGEPEKRIELEHIWNEFNRNLPLMCKEAKFENLVNVEVFLNQQLVELSRTFKDKDGTASFSITMIVKFEGKSYAISAHVGNSALIHMDRKGHLTFITPINREDPANKLELPSLEDSSPIFYSVHPVKAGDRIFGLTDGIIDFLPSKTLKSILQKFKTETNDQIIDKLKNAIEQTQSKDASSKPKDKASKEFDPKDKNKSDDLSAFVLVVPK